MNDDIYLGKVSNIITVQELVSLIGLNKGANKFTGDITWLYFKTKESKELLVAEQSIRSGVSYDDLEAIGVVKTIDIGYRPELQGKTITINNKQYKCRILTGGDDNPATKGGGEWDRLITRFVPDNEDSNWYWTLNWCQEVSKTRPDGRIWRGDTKVDGFNYRESNFSNGYYVFRPVLELVNVNKFLIKSQNKFYTVFNDEWVETALVEPLNQSDYEQYGMNSLENIPVDFLNQLDEFEILSWTTDLEKTPKLEFIVPKYKPIMTLHEPEIVTMTNTENPQLHIEGFRDLRPYCESENPDLLILSQSKPNIYTNLIPDPQLILPKGDIQFKMLDKVLSFNMTATEQNKGLIRLIFSIDSGTTWQTYNSNTLEFKQIDIQDLGIVESDGMTVDIFNSIGTKWNEVVQNSKIRFGYYLKIDDMSDVANVDKLEVTIDVLGVWDATLHEIDYNYEYDNEKIYIELYRDGSYKINYI